MSADLTFVPTPPPPPDSLTGALLAGTAPVELPLAGAESPAPGRREAGLGTDAFRITTPEIGEALERALGGEGFVVTTGQQPLLFLGPLYVLYKALTAIALARRIEISRGAPVAPVFWIASDDHDWEEVGTTRILDRHTTLRTLAIEPPPGFEGRPAGPAPLPESIRARIDDLAQLVPDSEFISHYLSHIRGAYRPGNAVAEAFGSALAGVLRERGIACLDSGSPPVKEASIPLFRRMLEEPRPVLDALEAGARALESGGIEPPIPVLSGALPLFYDTGEGRERLYLDEGGLRAGRDGPVAPGAEWRNRLGEEPMAFSPNVASRPVLESALLPVTATVLGPGELAYWSQLRPLFACLDVPFPRIQPRASWTVLERRPAELLERLSLEPEELADGGDAAVAALTGEERPPAVEESLAGLRRMLGQGMGAVERALGDALPGLRASVGKTRKALFDAVAELGGQVDAEVRRQQETRIEQIRRVAVNLYPDGQPQERVLSPFYFLSRYGDRFVEVAADRTGEWLETSLAGASGGG